MKKFLLAISLFPIAAAAQPLVSASPENRTTLVEQFTGLYAGEGVQGNNAAMAVYMNNPLEVSIINYHAGPFSVPIGNDPDFSTMDGNTIGNYFSVQQHPRGVVNRRPFPQVYALNYTDYQAASNAARALTSPVNLGMASTFNATTRELSVDVEILYTANSPGGNDYITVALIENDVVGWQTDFTNPNGADTAYNHPRMFRTMLAGTWGDEVMTTTAGHTETRTYSVVVDSTWNIANCQVVAFIGELQDDVYQARHVPADGGTTTLSIAENPFDRVLGAAFPVPATDNVTIPFFSLESTVSLRITDALGRIVHAEQIPQQTAQSILSVATWSAGIYSYQIISNDGRASTARTFQVQ
jgi:hypothetical protein